MSDTIILQKKEEVASEVPVEESVYRKLLFRWFEKTMVV